MCEVYDQKFFEREGQTLAEFAFWFAEQQKQTSRKSNNRDNSLLTLDENT